MKNSLKDIEEKKKKNKWKKINKSLKESHVKKK